MTSTLKGRHSGSAGGGMAGRPSRTPLTRTSSTSGASLCAAAGSAERTSGSRRGTVAVTMASQPVGEPAATCGAVSSCSVGAGSGLGLESVPGKGSVF